MLDPLGVQISLEIVMRVLIGSTKWATKTFLDCFEKPGERRELIGQLFLDQGEFLFHPGTDWRPAPGQDEAPFRGRGYPHELLALRSFVPFLSETSGYQETLFFPAEVNPQSRIVCAGSPKSNPVARTYLPSFELTEDGARQQYPTLLRAQSLKYFFGEDLTAPRVQVVSMMQPGKTAAKTRKVLWKWRGKDDIEPWQPKGYKEGRELRRDFLLVSRLPRTSIGGDILMFSGGHGAGTEATRLLLHRLHIRQLRELVDLLPGKPYYQFVIEVTKVEHGKRGTVPKRIEISEALPPVVLNVSAADLLGHAVKGRKVW
jgi:hypothetical protein